MSGELERASAARLPASALAELADLRRAPGLLAAEEGGRAWLLWTAPDPALARRLLAVPGAALYVERAGRWHRLGRRLPDPEGGPGGVRFGPLGAVLVPGRVEPEPPPETTAPGPALLRLVRDPEGVPRAATGWLGPVGALARWAGSAAVPSARLAGLRAARSGGIALVVGDRPPEIAEGVRLWGARVLAPLGFRPDPDPGEAALRALLGVAGEDRLLLTEAGAEVVPRSAFRTLRRASARLAAGPGEGGA